MRSLRLIQRHDHAQIKALVCRFSSGLFGVGLTLLLLAGVGQADPSHHPVFKQGRCPSGYHVSGAYCMSS